jgi:hypothetical protein
VSNLPIAPVKQLAEIHYYREGAVEYLTTRYAEPTKDSGLRWQITRTEET